MTQDCFETRAAGIAQRAVRRDEVPILGLHVAQARQRGLQPLVQSRAPECRECRRAAQGDDDGHFSFGAAVHSKQDN
jgi:hypothetical protein